MVAFCPRDRFSRNRESLPSSWKPNPLRGPKYFFWFYRLWTPSWITFLWNKNINMNLSVVL